MYTADFNPITRDLVVFRQDIRREMIATYLVALCRFYYEQQTDPVISMSKVFREGEQKHQVALPVLGMAHQCMACYTVYDELYGEPGNGIEAGTTFAKLPVSYCCSTCGGTITNFSEIQVDSLEAGSGF
jgi:rubredoxin